MGMLSKLLGNISLASMLGCSSQQPTTPMELPSLSAKTTANAEKLEGKVINFSFALFNPPNAEELISLEGPMKRYIFSGLDADETGEETSKINNYLAFEHGIYQTAQKLGYAPEQVDRLSPREAIILTCKIVGYNHNYFGRSLDYEQEKAQARRTQWLNDLFRRLGSGCDEDRVKIAQEGEKLMDELAEARQRIESIEGKLAELGGGMTLIYGGVDSLFSDEVFEKIPFIVCRHYAPLARDVFSILKGNNPYLRNTHVSTYAAGKHMWNQVVTLHKGEEGKTEVDLALFDPTWFDEAGIMGGQTRYHLIQAAHFPTQLEAFKKAVASSIKK